MKIRKKITAVPALLLSALIFSGCSDFEQPGPSVQKSKACISVSIQGFSETSAKRTVLPDTTVDNSKFSSLKLYAKKTESDDWGSPLIEQTSYSDFLSSQAHIEAGDWIFKLDANYDGAEFSGEIKQNIELEKQNKLVFTLSTDKSTPNKGFTVTVNYTGNPVKAVAKIFSADNNELDSEEASINSTGDTAGSVTYTYNKTPGLDNGTYKLRILFYADNDEKVLLNTYPDEIRLAGGFESKRTFNGFNLNDAHQIIYHDDDGSPADGADKQFTFSRKSDKIDLPSMFKDGYAFAGWYKDSAYSDGPIDYINPAEYDSDIHLYALFVNSVTVKPQGTGSSGEITVTTLEDAVSKINEWNTKIAYTIYIDGQLGASSIENTITTDNAESITLQGKNGLTDDVPADKISNSTESDAQSLLISTKVPVTIKNLEIKGSERPIWFGETAFNVTLGEGCLISAPSRTGTDYALYFGSEEQSGTLILDDGKINTNGTCGGVKIDGGKFIMNNGEISGNKASLGAAVHIAGGMFTMNGGTISGNEATEKGGAVYVGYDATDKNLTGTFIMTNGTIQGNTASDSGGGVYIAGNYGTGTELTGNITFDMQGGTITGNTAPSGAGVYQETSDANTGVFNMGGDAIVDNSNDVYLEGSINVTGELTGETADGKVATITPATYAEGNALIEFNDKNLVSHCDKFAVTPQTQGSGDTQIKTSWKIVPGGEESKQGILSVIKVESGITITFAGVVESDIDVEQYTHVDNQVTFTVTNSDSYKEFVWSVDGNIQEGENDYTFTLNFADLADGHHIISVEAKSTTEGDTYTYSWAGEYTKTTAASGGD